MGNFISRMNTRDKSILMFIGTFLLTIAVAVCIIVITIASLWNTTNCGDMTNALAALLITIAVLFLASVVVVGVAAQRFIPNRAGCLAAVIGYGIVILTSYLCVGFGLLVLFNC